MTRAGTTLLAATVGLLAGGCFEDGSGNGSSGSASDGSTGDGTTSAATDATTDSASASASASGTSTGGCPDGAAGCGCYGNGTCDQDLVCENDICLPPGCTPGVEGCPCMDGLCLGDLVCDNGLCQQPTGSTGGASATSGGSTSGTTDATSGGTTDATTTDTGGGDGIYTPCDSEAACVSVLADGVCAFNAGDPFGLCTLKCDSDGDCPGYMGSAALCTDVSGVLVCVPSCAGGTGCPTGFTCAGGLCY